MAIYFCPVRTLPLQGMFIMVTCEPLRLRPTQCVLTIRVIVFSELLSAVTHILKKCFVSIAPSLNVITSESFVDVQVQIAVVWFDTIQRANQHLTTGSVIHPLRSQVDTESNLITATQSWKNKNVSSTRLMSILTIENTRPTQAYLRKNMIAD